MKINKNKTSVNGSITSKGEALKEMYKKVNGLDMEELKNLLEAMDAKEDDDDEKKTPVDEEAGAEGDDNEDDEEGKAMMDEEAGAEDDEEDDDKKTPVDEATDSEDGDEEDGEKTPVDEATDSEDGDEEDKAMMDEEADGDDEEDDDEKTPVDEATPPTPNKQNDKKSEDETSDDDDEAIDGPKGSKEIAETFKVDLNALCAGESSLSEAFRQKAAVIFEGAVNAQVKQHVARLEKAYKKRVNENTAKIENRLAEGIDAFLSHATDHWLTENKLAVENGLRGEIVESFINSMRDVFAEHYVEIPSNKVDLVDELSTKVDRLQKQMTESVELYNKVKKENAKLQRDRIIAMQCEGLTMPQADKLKTLAEGVSFDSADDFKSKVQTLKESYFGKKGNKPAPQTLDESFEGTGSTDMQANDSDPMNKYTAALARLAKQ